MIFKQKPKKDVADPDVDKLATEIYKLCLGHGTGTFELVHEALVILDHYFVVGMDNLYPMTFVVAMSAAKAHYDLMVKKHGLSSKRDELPWTEINAVHAILAEYLADHEPQFASDSEYEFRPEIVSRIRMMMIRFTSSRHGGSVGHNVWQLLIDKRQA